LQRRKCGQQLHLVGPVERVREHEIGDRRRISNDELAPVHVRVEHARHRRELLAASTTSSAAALLTGYRFVWRVMRHSGCSSSVAVNSSHRLWLGALFEIGRMSFLSGYLSARYTGDGHGFREH